ncbi:hypothetical protein F7725_001779, partial [Dissostichus mawsoni]
AQEVVIRCPLNHVQCIGSKKCIHFNKLCNGARDCEDGYDEGVHCRVGVVAKVTSHHPSCQNRQEKQQGSSTSYTKLLSAPGFCEDSVCYVIAAVLAQWWPLSGRDHNLFDL